jgi:hypothetical protein
MRAVEDQGMREIKGQTPEGVGHRNKSVQGNEGVGEHVRTRFHAGLWAR